MVSQNNPFLLLVDSARQGRPIIHYNLVQSMGMNTSQSCDSEPSSSDPPCSAFSIVSSPFLLSCLHRVLSWIRLNVADADADADAVS